MRAGNDEERRKAHLLAEILARGVVRVIVSRISGVDQNQLDGRERVMALMVCTDSVTTTGSRKEARS